MRVGIKASRVVARRVESVARTAAEVVREACAGGDSQALGRFLGTFADQLRAPTTPPTTPIRTARPANSGRSR